MRWIVRAQLVLGIWLAVAPWILGYAEVTTALWGSIVGGALVFLLALWAMFGGRPPSHP